MKVKSTEHNYITTNCRGKDSNNLGLLQLVKECYIDLLQDKNLNFCLIFGSRATNSYSIKSDIDIMFIYQDQISKQKYSLIISKYKQIHDNFNLNYSKKYPVEIICSDDVNLALKGKGFNIVSNKIQIKPVFEDDWNLFNNYRFWLCVLSSQTFFFHGNSDSYQEIKSKALKSLVIIIIIHTDRQTYTVGSISGAIIGSGKEFLGFANNKTTVKYLNTRVRKILSDLELKKVLTCIDGIYHINDTTFFDDFINEMKYVNRL